MKSIAFLFFFISAMAYSQINLVSSNLPIVKITTPVGQEINDLTRIVCDMGVIDNPGGLNLINDSFNNYNGKIAIEFRGSTSQQYPKKSYGFETQNAIGANNNVSLMGLPLENDWILNGPYPDKTLLRDALTYDLSRKMGHYASDYRYCELLINNQYLGIYLLLERIKRDNVRVDIAHIDLDDLAGDSLTGGYIIKVDKLTGESGITWNSNYSDEVVFQFHDPESDELLPQQINYIESFVSNFEQAIQADPEGNYLQWIEPISFYDFFILQELGRTVDGYRSSSFMYKDKNSGNFQGRLVAGPMWDFNLSYGNADYCAAYLTTGWQYDFDQIYDFTTEIPFWWSRLLDAPSYRNGLRCHWEELRQGPLHTDSINYWIDSMAFLLEDARIRNFIQWPIIGEYVNWNAFVGNTYQEDVYFMKNYVSDRASWLDQNIPGTCNSGLTMQSLKQTIRAYPNPTSTWLSVSANTLGIITVHDVFGNSYYRELDTNKIWVGDLTQGIYFITFSTQELGQSTIKFIKQ